MNGIKIREDFQYNIGDYLDFSDGNLTEEHYNTWYYYLLDDLWAIWNDYEDKDYWDECTSNPLVGITKGSLKLFHGAFPDETLIWGNKLNPKDVFENFSELHTVRIERNGDEFSVSITPNSSDNLQGDFEVTTNMIHSLNSILFEREDNLKLLTHLEQQLEDLEEEVRKLYYKDEEYKQQIEDYFIKN